MVRYTATPVAPRSTTPSAAIATVHEVDASPLGAARPEGPVDGVVSGETDGDAEPEGDADEVGDPPGVVGAIVGDDLRTTVTRPHIPQSGNGASLPWMRQ